MSRFLSECESPGCAGSQVRPFERCLAHLTPGQLDEFLASRQADQRWDARGTRLSNALVGRVLATQGDRPLSADFSFSVFTDAVSFADCRFGDVLFNHAEFFHRADFDGCVFMQRAEFEQTRFLRKSSFRRAEFDGTASFAGAVFEQRGSFALTQFRQEATFDLAQLAAQFINAQFRRSASFREATFSEPFRVTVRRTG